MSFFHSPESRADACIPFSHHVSVVSIYLEQQLSLSFVFNLDTIEVCRWLFVGCPSVSICLMLPHHEVWVNDEMNVLCCHSRRPMMLACPNMIGLTLITWRLCCQISLGN
jgi:hypothetical protein